MTPGLTEALERGGSTHTLDDVLKQVERGDAQLWTTEGAVIVTEVSDTPQKRVIHFWLATGELESVIGLSHKILEWAKDTMGCEQATLAGRKGWTRALATEGWHPMLVVMGRDL